MRSKGQRVALTLACLIYACDIYSYAYAQNQNAMVVAQAAVSRLTITAGSQNPVGTISVARDTQNLSALQLMLTSDVEAVAIDTVTIGFGAAPLEDLNNPLGNDGLVDFIRVRLIADLNGNGIHDSDEPVLDIQEAEDFEDGEATTVNFTFAPPLVISPDHETIWLVTLDINSGDRTAENALLPQTVASWSRLGWLALSLPLLGVLLYGYQTCPLPWRYIALILCVYGGLTLSACDSDDDDDAFVFVVNLPRNGLTSQSVRLGPEAAIPGATIRLTES